ncbi:FG-GAP repeat domain-containing protein [Membranihabitans maritimus]|uniref:FG-GAP repeat domain-containing protein n=1 Tax=Membranihabitans maritimus TaxID=2904244 RepID=UPI001F20225E|nr:VCBS repeat-containing protein [Membranihabitans maritimus]
MKLIFIIIGLFYIVSCTEITQNSTERVDHQYFKASFEHHYVTRDLPGSSDWGYGCPTLADFDNDGDLDYSFSGPEGLYWFENGGVDSWTRHDVGILDIRALGANSFDVDNDGWKDIVIGGNWFRNPQSPTTESFYKYTYDPEINSNIHDIVIEDIDGDRKKDVIVLGEDAGLFWYKIPENSQGPWTKFTITLDVLESKDHIHAGFFPRGVDDLDGDGDADVVLPDRWLENIDNGKNWKRHPLPFGKRGPYGLSSRSWITDLDNDGDADIVMTDCDQVASRAAWLENDGGIIPRFTTRFLPFSAPGIRGSFHSLFVGDLDNDGDKDIMTCDQEDDSIPPEGASPRWYVWENFGNSQNPIFEERVIANNRIGGHDALVGDLDNDGDLDIISKVWNLWPESGNNGVEHADLLENKVVN